MAFSPQPSNEDFLLGSDQSPEYNNAVAQDDTMCYGSEDEHSSGDELLVGDHQDADYSQLDRVIGGGSRASQTVGVEERRQTDGAKGRSVAAAELRHSTWEEAASSRRLALHHTTRAAG